MIRRPPRSTLFPYTTPSDLTGVDLPALVGRWFAVGDALLFGMKRCPPCTHLERLTGTRLVKAMAHRDRKSTRLNSSHANISYAVFCLKKKKTQIHSYPFYLT